MNWISTYLLILPIAIVVSSSKNCFVIRSFDNTEKEYQCPSSFIDDQNGTVIKTTSTKMLIDCFVDEFRPDMLPNEHMPFFQQVVIRKCGIPRGGIGFIFRALNTSTTSLKFSLTDLSSFQFGKDQLPDIRGLQELDLRSNNLRHLDENAFENYPDLVMLDLGENQLELTPGLFQNTLKLEVLDLSSNKLTHLPDGLFRGLKKLRILHIWNNNLSNIRSGEFKDLVSLRSLEFTRNNIEIVEEDAFSELRDLTSVSFFFNNLRNISRNLFKNNPRLESLNFANNSNIVLGANLFANMTNLKSVNLFRCNLTDLPETLFLGSPNLTHINLSYNQLEYLPVGIFETQRNLAELRLNRNQLKALPEKLFTNLGQLQLLHLQHNLISELNFASFVGLDNLRELDLSYNRIYSIESGSFTTQQKLIKLNLAHNLYNYTDEGLPMPITNALKLEEVDLSYNLIRSFPQQFSYNLIHIKKVDFSFNRLESLPVGNLWFISNHKVHVNFKSNNITFLDFDGVDFLAVANVNNTVLPNVKANLEDNEIICDCRALAFARYIDFKLDPIVRKSIELVYDKVTCKGPKYFANMPVSEISPRMLTCPLDYECTSNASCECYSRPDDNSILVYCSRKNLTVVPRLLLRGADRFCQTEVHLNDNKLKRAPLEEEGYNNTVELYLDNNSIDNITWIPPKIDLLYLHGNQLTHLDFEVLQQLQVVNLTVLSLSGNPWRCDCESSNFTSYLRLNIPRIDVQTLKCNNSDRFLVDLTEKELCEVSSASIIIAVVVLIILCFIFLTTSLFYKYQQEVKIWLYDHELLLFWVKEEELDNDKIYDAFISYSHKDEDFVTQNLLPVLENGPQPYKLCLHYRHFVPGEFIATQVVKSVKESRRTLVILSPSFLESVWGKMEFRTAHTQAMKEGRARVIVVLLGEVDVKALDDELKAYLETNTYVKWGDPWFWRKLKYALPHSSRKFPKHVDKHSKIMNFIDDKFELMAPTANSSPGSTPPLVLNPTLLKKHPLNLINAQLANTPPAEGGEKV